MGKRVLDVGNCGPDHSSIKDLIQRNFGAEIVRAHGHSSALAELQQGTFDLVLVNRLMDADGSSGLEVIQSVVEQFAETPVMMITNFSEHQASAVAAGAAPGFGKSQLHSPDTVRLLQQYLA